MYVVTFLTLGNAKYILDITLDSLQPKTLFQVAPGIYHLNLKTVFVNIDIPFISLEVSYNFRSRISVVYVVHLMFNSEISFLCRIQGPISGLSRPISKH